MKKIKKPHIFILLFSLFIPLILLGCENSNKNSLSTPTIVEIRGGTIVFNTIDDADYYTISINNMEITVDVKHNKNVELIDNMVNYDASKIFVVGDSYSVKIRANSSKKANSNFSSVISYKHGGSIKTPTDIKINGTTLTWGVAENASYYLVKVVTPNDKVVLDKNGNILSLDDPESIANADLTEYAFNSNQFDFSSLLSVAGNYQFYVCAVLSNGSSYVESTYSSKITYSHYVSLEAPTNGQVYLVKGDLNLITAVDPNANAISIKCNDVVETHEINNSDKGITKLAENFLDVNLTKYFNSSINAGKLNLSDIKQFSFSTQSVYSSANPDLNFYHPSVYSQDVIFEHTHQLSSPVLSLSKFGENHLASWTYAENDLISGFKFVLFTASGLKEYLLNSDTLSMLIAEDFIAVSVQAVGKGNYLSSAFSNLVANEINTETINNFSYSTAGTTLSWNEVEDAYYVVEFNNEYHVLTSTSFEIPANELKSNNFSIKVHVVKDGFVPFSETISLTYSSQLNAPTFSASQGFNGSTLYELTFTGVENAIGYYVYIKSESSDVYEKIETLYTSTSIDLSHYISNSGEYTNYLVKVQAVADQHGLFISSELSSSVQVSHVRVLDSPRFYKVNDTTYPVVKETTGGTTNYFLQFYGVDGADSYEVLINFNKLTISNAETNGLNLHKVNITNYLSSANNYEIKIRAIPSSSAVNVEASEYSTTNYTLTKQLPSVENIKVTENEGVYTLSFDPVDNAASYLVRIVKENDSSYVEYLESLGLKLTFETSPSTDISQYVQQQGNYSFYVTALAPKNSYYANANESLTFGSLNKLTSLEKPSNIEFVNVSKDEFNLTWNGDNNTDYYLVKLTDPNGISSELKVLNSTGVNINQYMTIQGTYYVDIYSMVDTLGETAKEYTSSSATNANYYYTYSKEQDFLRYSISMYGQSYNFVVEDIEDLKNLLWYHCLYEINENIGLNIMLELQPIVNADYESVTIETLREAIIRLANEANNLLLHNFSNDQTWLSITETASDIELFSYVTEKLLNIYPELHVLSEISVDSSSNNIFNLKYKNTLKQVKEDYTQENLFTNTNYGNDFTYIDLYSRKSATGFFKIDSRKEALVTTTEQLLQAVQYGYKPAFIGDSATAETVYANAKLVLSAIITNNMSDLEKVTAIFDWLEYAFDLTYYTDANGKTHISGSLESSNLEVYGAYKHYYLEGIFENITKLATGDLVIGNRFATSWSYSKAFALLCAIEGIDAVVVNGSYSYIEGVGESQKEIVVDHVWNKVYVNTSGTQSTDKSWYALDLTFSDNRIYFADLDKGYGISSHTYFLTTDYYAELNLNVKDNSNLISENYATTRACSTTYDYYANSTFGLTYNQLSSTVYNFYDDDGTLLTTDFKYLKKFNPDETYQIYAKTTGYGSLQAFLLNAMIYSEYMADNNASGKSTFEFKFNWSNNESSPVFNLSKFTSVSSSFSGYAIDLKRVNDSTGTSSIYSVQDTLNSTTTVIFILEKTE